METKHNYLIECKFTKTKSKHIKNQQIQINIKKKSESNNIKNRQKHSKNKLDKKNKNKETKNMRVMMKFNKEINRRNNQLNYSDLCSLEVPTRFYSFSFFFVDYCCIFKILIIELLSFIYILCMFVLILVIFFKLCFGDYF